MQDVEGPTAELTRAGPAAVVEWRDGVHLVPSGLWCDSLGHPAGLCFLSSAQALLGPVLRPTASGWSAPAQPLLGSVLCSEKSWTLGQALAARLPDPPSLLRSPCGRPFTLGSLRLELFPAGGLPGATSLLVRLADGRSVVYAGAPNPTAAPHREAMQLRAAELLICQAPLAAVSTPLPTVGAAIEQLQRQRQVGASQQALTVVLCSVLSTAPELAELLASDAAAGRYQLLAHPRIGRAIRALGQLALREAAPARPILPGPSDGVLLWPVDEPLPTAGQLSRSGRLNIVLCSGAALLPSAVAACRRRLAASGLTLAAALPYPDAIDRPGLLRYIVATGARQIYLTAGFSDSLAAELRAIQVVAWPLGPPQQLALFQ